jgi:large subunit ribosomal protein L12
MEYIYAAMLLHKAGKKVDEHGLKHVLEAAGLKADEGKVKAVAAALEGVNIDDAIKNASVAVAAPAAAAPAKKEEKKKDEKKEEKKTEEEAAAGLGALFG